MSKTSDIVLSMRSNPAGVKFSELYKVCIEYFGEPRNSGGSHYVFKTPWAGDPRVNIQDKGDTAKPYQVRQVLKAIERAEELEGELESASK